MLPSKSPFLAGISPAEPPLQLTRVLKPEMFRFLAAVPSPVFYMVDVGTGVCGGEGRFPQRLTLGLSVSVWREKIRMNKERARLAGSCLWSVAENVPWLPVPPPPRALTSPFPFL